MASPICSPNFEKSIEAKASVNGLMAGAISAAMPTKNPWSFTPTALSLVVMSWKIAELSSRI